MLRVFTKDVGRFKKGETREYTRQVWESLAKSIKLKLDDFTKLVILEQNQK